MQQPQPIPIAFACGENFDNMPVQGEGRMCGKCNTLVVDFTKMSLEEIHRWFEARKGEKICGRYQSMHTDVPTRKRDKLFLHWYNHVASRRIWRPLRLSVLFFLTLAFLAVGCQSRKKTCTTMGGRVSNFY